MSDVPFDEREESPTLEVRVYRHGERIHEELCESEEQASLVVEAWSEMDGVTCEVDDLSVRHEAGDIPEPEPVERLEEDRAELSQVETRPRRYD